MKRTPCFRRNKRIARCFRLFFYLKMESLLDTDEGYAIMKYRPLSAERRRAVKNRLEALRKERGISQKELASAMEGSRQSIGSLENGRYNPSILLAFRLARYFDRSIEEIFIYEEEKQ